MMNPLSSAAAAALALTSLLGWQPIPQRDVPASTVSQQPAGNDIRGARNALDMIRVGTYNIKDTLPVAAATRTLDAFAAGADVAGLQEFGGPGRNQALRQLEGWSAWRPDNGGPPVLWRTSRFRFLSGQRLLLARARTVEFSPGFKAHLPDYIGTLVRLRHTSTGQVVSVLNVHAPAHIDLAGRPRRTVPRRVAMYTETITAAAAAARVEVAHHRSTFVVGDLNVDFRADNRHRARGFPVSVFGRQGLTSMWAHINANSGSHGSRLIDGVWAAQRPLAGRVLTRFHVSDHKPAVAVYRLR